MRRHIAALLALLAVAAPSFAQTPVGVQSMTPSRTSIGNTGGALWTTDPFATQSTFYSNIINTGGSGVAPGSASVSSPKDTRGWEAMALMLYARNPVVATTTALQPLAIQIRGSSWNSSDTLTSLPWAWPRIAAPSAHPDSVGGWAGIGMPWQGPTTVDVADDTATFSKHRALASEIVVVLSPGDYRRGKYIPLQMNGSTFRAPYTVVRVRPLTSRTNNGVPVDSAAIVYRADLVRIQ